MKIVFGQVPDEFVGLGEHFIGRNINGDQAEFFYKLEVEEETDGNGTITITDTSERIMPLDFDNLDELVAILQDIQEYRNDRAEFVAHWKRRFGLPA